MGVAAFVLRPTRQWAYRRARFERALRAAFTRVRGVGVPAWDVIAIAKRRDDRIASSARACSRRALT